jgi:hypothetical protein
MQRIMETLSLDAESCKKTLMSLCQPKVRILMRASQQNSASTEAVAINESQQDEEMVENSESAA